MRKSSQYLAVLFGLCTSTWDISAASLSVADWGGIEDRPIDGIGDALCGAYIIQAPSIVCSAVVEYDAAAFTGMRLGQAVLEGTIHVNNAFDTGVRNIGVFVFEGNGVLDPSDFHLPAAHVGTVSYHPPHQLSASFRFDVTDEMQVLLDEGATYIGFRYAALNRQSPSQLPFVQEELPVLTLAPIPEPSTVLLMLSSLATLLASRAGWLRRFFG